MQIGRSVDRGIGPSVWVVNYLYGFAAPNPKRIASLQVSDHPI